jgi:hypothetical protein
MWLLIPARAIFMAVILRSGVAATKNLALGPHNSEILRFAQNDSTRVLFTCLMHIAFAEDARYDEYA